MSQGRTPRRLPGLRDLDAERSARLSNAAARCRDLFRLRGYAQVETPIMEETELFLRKTGGEVSSRLYNFTDPGGYRVSLRPEFTAPVLRHVAETTGFDALPVRRQYSGPVFRYSAPPPEAPPEHTRLAQAEFIQTGAELIGSAAPDADGEIISMAWEGLKALGVRQPTLAIGHVGMLWELLRPFQLSERARYFLVRNVSRLREGPEAWREVREEAGTLGLLHTGEGSSASGGAVVDLPDTNDQEALSLIESVLGYTVGGGDNAPETSRSAGEIVARLARKLTSADDPATVESALALLSSLARVNGPASKALDECRAVIRNAGHDDAAVDRLAEVVEAAERQGTPTEAMVVEPTLARDIAYYTGAIFDLTDSDNARSLGGGGRYDGLLQALGVEVDVPALGFSYDLDAVLAATDGVASGSPERIVLVRPETPDARAAAAEFANSERSTGAVALLEMYQRTRQESARYAASCGASEILSVHADGRVDREAV